MQSAEKRVPVQIILIELSPYGGVATYLTTCKTKKISSQFQTNQNSTLNDIFLPAFGFKTKTLIATAVQFNNLKTHL